MMKKAVMGGIGGRRKTSYYKTIFPQPPLVCYAPWAEYFFLGGGDRKSVCALGTINTFKIIDLDPLCFNR